VVVLTPILPHYIFLEFNNENHENLHLPRLSQRINVVYFFEARYVHVHVCVIYRVVLGVYVS